jgi:hypothetical protein
MNAFTHVVFFATVAPNVTPGVAATTRAGTGSEVRNSSVVLCDMEARTGSSAYYNEEIFMTAKLIVAYPQPTDAEAFEKVYNEEHVPLPSPGWIVGNPA